MILVRTELQCKWGRTQEVLKRTKTGMEQLGGQFDTVKRTRILTDLSGSFDTVIVESEVESLDAYFAMLNAIFAGPEFQAMQAGMVDNHPYASGNRHYYTIEAVYES